MAFYAAALLRATTQCRRSMSTSSVSLMKRVHEAAVERARRAQHESAGSSVVEGSDETIAVYVSDVDDVEVPLMLGITNYFERHLPYVGCAR